MNERDLDALKHAVALIESPTLGIKIANLMGIPIEAVLRRLPGKASDKIGLVAQEAISLALNVAMRTMEHHPPGSMEAPPVASNWWHKVAVATTGAGGGAFGLAALALELPISTTIMMRSIADIARSEGANLHCSETQIECVQVLALGGVSAGDDATDTGYFVARNAMSKAVSDATTYIAKNGLKRIATKQAAPPLVRLITQIAQRFSITVTQKAAAQLVPIVGGFGGAIVNTLFIDHFQSMARGHFAVRRLERTYGPDTVREKFAQFVPAQSSRMTTRPVHSLWEGTRRG